MYMEENSPNVEYSWINWVSTRSSREVIAGQLYGIRWPASTSVRHYSSRTSAIRARGFTVRHEIRDLESDGRRWGRKAEVEREVIIR